jgi:hypothetical protein
MTPLILRCPRCRAIRRWDQSKQPGGPETCDCGAWADWHVLKEEPPPEKHGHVIVMTDRGWQQLSSPWDEDPNGWRPYPVRYPTRQT